MVRVQTHHLQYQLAVKSDFCWQSGQTHCTAVAAQSWPSCNIALQQIQVRHPALLPDIVQLARKIESLTECFFGLQAGPGAQPDAFDPNAQHNLQAPDDGHKRKQPDNGFGASDEVHQANGFASSPTARNAPPAHDVFRMRRKQRTKMAER